MLKGSGRRLLIESRLLTRFQSTVASSNGTKTTVSLNQLVIQNIQNSKQKPINQILEKLNQDISSKSLQTQRLYTNDFNTNRQITDLISRSKYDYKTYVNQKYAFENDIPPTPYELFNKLDNLKLIQPYHYTLLTKYYFDEKNFKELLSFYVNNSGNKEVFDSLLRTSKRESNLMKEMIVVSYLETCSSKEKVDLEILLKFLNNNFTPIDHSTFRSLIQLYYFKQRGPNRTPALDVTKMAKFHELYKQFFAANFKTETQFKNSLPQTRLGLSYLIDLKNHYLPYVYEKNNTPEINWIMESIMDHYSYKMFTDLYKEYPNDIYSNRSLLYALGKNVQDSKDVRYKRIQAVWNSFFQARSEPALGKQDYLAMIKSLGELKYENKLTEFFTNPVDIPEEFKLKNLDLKVNYYYYLLNNDAKNNYHSFSTSADIETTKQHITECLKFLKNSTFSTAIKNSQMLKDLVQVLGMRLSECNQFQPNVSAPAGVLESQSKETPTTTNNSNNAETFNEILASLEFTALEKNLVIYNKLLNTEIIENNSLMIESNHFDFAKVASFTKNTKFYSNLLRYLPNNYSIPNNYLTNIIETCIIQLSRQNQEDLAIQLFELNYAKFINLNNTRNFKNVRMDNKVLINSMIAGLSTSLKYSSRNNVQHISKILKNLDHFVLLYLKSFETLHENLMATTNSSANNNNNNNNRRKLKNEEYYLDDRSMKQILMNVVDLNVAKLPQTATHILRSFTTHYTQHKEIFNKNMTSVEITKVENLIKKLAL